MSKDDYSITIIFPSFNRARRLEEAMRSIMPQIKSLANARVELLIVDNNSADDTEATVRRLMTENPCIDVKYVREGKQGLSHARNRGILEARGRLLAFVDDDIEFAEGWLARCLELFSTRAEIDILGGPVLPYGMEIPTWIPTRYAMLIGICPFHGKLEQVDNVPGGNCCMRREVATTVGEFNAMLGRRGNLLLMGEENDYFSRARKQGFKIFVSEDLLVYHKVAEKLHPEYVLQNAISSGSGLKAYDAQEHSKPYCAMKWCYYCLRYVLCTIQGRLHPRDTNAAIISEIEKGYAKGYIRGVRIMAEKIC
jgi:glycosyltransferase involved in cell wall biosynthesis